MIFIVLGSTFLGLSSFATGGEPNVVSNSSPTLVSDRDIQASDTVITKNWHAVETLESWWNSNWAYRKKITITEPTLMDREREPVDIYLTFTGNEARVNSIRLTLYNGSTNSWFEVPSQVWNATTHSNGTANFYDRCSVMFLLNMTKADTEIYYIYYDPIIFTAPSYTDRITVRGANDPNITDDLRLAAPWNPSMNHSNGTVYSNIDSFQIITNGNFATPRAKVCLVDTMRQGSDWGGPACSIFSALQGATDVFNLAQQTWMSVGEMALQASNTPADESFTQVERCNVGPDNPREAWDLVGGRPVIVLDDGPLFVRIRIQTTDGAYANLVASPTAGDWHRDAILGTATDSVNRGASGSLGYVKYNITYTFFYYGIQTFAKIDLDILSAPQRGPINSGYPVTNGNYPRVTSVYFKNYGDWPHLGQLVRASTGAVSQDRKAWLGSKYSPDGTTVYNMPIADRRRDFPTEPWTAWYHSTNAAPSIGMFSITNSIGWEVTSLAVAGIGPNSLLQQILPEGHQGDMFNLTKGTILRYDYYLLTSAAGTNWSAARDTCRRMNKPVSIVVSSRELFNNNALFIHVNDRTGATALGVRVIVNNSADTATLNSTWVNSVGNTTHLRFPDGTYRVHVEMFTPNTGFRFIVNSQTVTLNHLVPSQRIVYRTYNTNMANLTIDLRNAARNNEALIGAQIRILNATTNATIEQAYTAGTTQRFRLLSGAPNTPYRVDVYYGGVLRVTNITSNPYPLNTNTLLRLGVAIETTSISVQTSDVSVNFGNTYALNFTYHKSNDALVKYRTDTLRVSSLYDSDYWVQGTDYTWSVNAANLVTLQLLTGSTRKINETRVFDVYVHAINNTVEEGIEKIFVPVNPIATGIDVFFNGANITASPSAEFNYTAVIQIRARYYQESPYQNLTTAVTITMDDGVHPPYTNFTLGAPYFTLTLNSSYFAPASRYTFKITASESTHETQVFAFTIFPRPLATVLNASLSSSMSPQMVPKSTITANWTDVVSVYLQYKDKVNNKFIITSTPGVSVFALIGTTQINAVIQNGTEWRININTATASVIVGGTTLVTLRATVPGGYELAEFIFNLYTKPIETKTEYSVNGMTQSGLDSTAFSIGSSLNFQVTVLTWDDTIVTAATTRVTYNNDTNLAQPDTVITLNPVGNNYTNNLLLDINTFYAVNQFFYLQIEKENYTSIVQPITIRVAAVPVNVSLIAEGSVHAGNTLTVEVNTQINFSISLDPDAFAAKFRQNISSIVVTLNVPYLQKSFTMTHAGNGVYWVLIDGPDYESDNVITVQIYIPQTLAALQLQYDIQTSYSFVITAFLPGGGIDPWVFWVVFGALIVMVVWFLAYQIRFKYPPMIRKIMDLKRSVNRGKIATRIPMQKVRSREEGIYHFYANTVNSYSFLQTRDTRYASKAAGYAPIPDESISLDFEMKAIDQPEVGLPAAPVPKGMMKKNAPTSYSETGMMNTGAPAPYGELPLPTTSSPGPVPVPGATPGIPKPITRPAPLSPGAPSIKPATPSITAMKPLEAKPGVLQVTRPLAPSAGVPPAVAKPAGPSASVPPAIKTLPKPAAGLPRPSIPAPKPAALGGMQDQVKPENLYQELVLLEQKRYKAERSMRDLDAKHARGTITDAEYNEYQKKIQDSLDKLKENIAQLRRKMLSF
jgi:hypothetical protein